MMSEPKMMISASSLLFSVLPMVNGCLPSPSNTIEKQIFSAQYTATLSKRNSGATSRGSTLVSVRLSSVLDTDTHGLIVLGVNGNKAVEMKWIDARHLLLSCASCNPDEVNFESVKTGDVNVSYDINLRQK